MIAIAAWAFYAPLSGAVIAPGYVKVDLNRKVAAPGRGIVRAIKVRDGDRVNQGQELVLLDDVRIDAQLDLLRTQLEAERAKMARLEAERVRAAAEFPRRSAEAGIHQARRGAVPCATRSARHQIEVLAPDQGVGGGGERARAADRREERALKLQKEELAANERLLEQGYVQKTRPLTAQRAVAEYEARHGERRAELSKARQRASELEFRILAMRNTYMQTATDELKESTSKLFDLEDRIRPSRDAPSARRSPRPSREVVGLRVFTAGSVIGPREVLMEIVPQEKRLIVEARIRPEDINHAPGSKPTSA